MLLKDMHEQSNIKAKKRLAKTSCLLQLSLRASQLEPPSLLAKVNIFSPCDPVGCFWQTSKSAIGVEHYDLVAYSGTGH